MSLTTKERLSAPTRMNSTNLYVTTTQIILKSEPNNPHTWQDLYRLIPYLRNSLCCVVCSVLLVDPLTPANAQCQHHLCKSCKGGRKKIKPQCESCKDCVDYVENRCLRILMQMYKKMCLNLINSQIFKCIKMQASQPQPGFERGASNLIQLIREGAMFEDNYESQGGLPKSTYSILPCIYTSSACSTVNSIPVPQTTQPDPGTNPSLQTQNSTNRASLYSVVYPGSGNKITIKRRSKDGTNNNVNNSNPPPLLTMNSLKPKNISDKPAFKRPPAKPKKGCRCGNATATPGKLTCCGQRCPCYVENKPCINCKCRGCRNPHRPDGNKVMPYIPELESQQQIVAPQVRDVQPPTQFQEVQPMSQLQDVQPVPQLQPLIPSQPPPALGVIPGHSGRLVDEPTNLTSTKLDSLQLDTRFYETESINSQFKPFKCKELEQENLYPYGNNMVYVTEIWHDI